MAGNSTLRGNILITVRYHKGDVAVLLDVTPNGGTSWDVGMTPEELGRIIFYRLGLDCE